MVIDPSLTIFRNSLAKMARDELTCWSFGKMGRFSDRNPRVLELEEMLVLQSNCALKQMRGETRLR